MKNIKALLLTLTFSGVYSLFAQQSKLDEAFKAFAENNQEKCVEALRTAATNASTAEQANMALFYLLAEENKMSETFAVFKTYFETAKNPWPFVRLIYFNNAIFGQHPMPKDRMALLDAMMKRADIPQDLLALLYHVKAQELESTNKFEQARALYKNNGSLLGWQAVGVFENISGGGFDRQHEPITKPDGKGFIDRNGAAVDWFTLPSYKMSGWVDLGYHFSTTNTVAFAQTFVYSPDDRTVFIRAGFGGAIKFWLNDNLIFMDEEEVNYEQSVVVIETKLKKGYNRMLVQLSASEGDEMNFLFRLTDANGKVMQDLSSKPEYQAYSKDKSDFKIIPPFQQTYFEKLVAAEPENPFHQIYLTKVYKSIGKKEDARRVMGNLEKKLDKNSMVKAEMYLIQSSLDNTTAQTKILEWFKQNDPNNSISVLLLVNEELNKQNFYKADSLLNIYQSTPSYMELTWMEKKIRILFGMRELEQGRELLDKAYKKYPLEGWVVQTQIALKRQVDKKPAEAEKMIKKYLAKKYNYSMYLDLAGYYLQTDRVPEGLAIYNKLLKDEPHNIALIKRLANINGQLKKYPEAIAGYQKCITMAPYVGSYYSALAEIQKETGKTLDAEVNFNKALKYDIFDYDTRKQIRILKGKKEDIFEYFSKIDVTDIIKKAPDKSEYPDDNSVVLAYDVNTALYKSGAAQQQITIVAKVFNTAGIDEWKEYNVPYGNADLEKAEIIKKDGSKLQAETNGSTVVFTNLEVGDAIHIVMRSDFYKSGKLKNHFWDNHYFQLLYPVLYNRYSLMTEPETKFKHVMNNDTVGPVIEKRSGFEFYTWKKEKTAAIKTEKLMGTLSDNTAILHISTVPDWKFISNWYSELSKNKAKSDFDVKEAVAEIFKGKTNLGDEEKARLIYDYIVKNIRYSSESFRQSNQIPQKAATVLNTKVGDCKDVSTLFLTIAREVGLKNTRLVLVNTRDNGKYEMMLPSTDFNHCIAAVDLNGKTHYVELTSDKNSFNTMDRELKGSFALPIYSEAESAGMNVEPVYLESELRVSNGISRNSTVSFDNRDMKINVVSSKTGGPATGTRYTYADINEDDRRKAMISALSSDKGNVKLEKLEFIRGLDNQSDTVVYKYDYRLLNFTTQITGMNIFTLPWADGNKSVEWVGEDTRKYNIDQWRWTGNDFEEETMVINLPEGKKLAEMPKNIHLECAAAVYDLKYKVEGSKITATRYLKYKMDVIPASNYDEVKKFWQEVVSEDQRQYAFK